MIRVVFDLPAKKPGTNIWDLPTGVSRATTEGAPTGKMLGYVSDATGWEVYDPANYVEPDTRPEVALTGASGAGVVHFDTEAPDFLIAKKGDLVTLTATNAGPAGTWSTPIQSPTAVKYATTTKAEGAGTMTVSLVFDEAGDWQLSEALINRDLPPALQVRFAGLKVRVVLN